MKAKYVGDPRHDGDGPKSVTLHGVTFPKNEWVGDLPPALEAKLPNNSHFEVSGASVEKPPNPPLAEVNEVVPQPEAADDYPHLTPAQEKALDRDGEGEPGGSTATDEKAALIAELEAMGVEVDKRLGVPKLKALVDEQKFIKGED